MQKETIAEYLKQNHIGEQNAVTSRELEIAFEIRGKGLRDLINTYFYAASEQEVRATIAHMTHRISGIAAAIHGLTQSLEQYDKDQLRLPLEGGGSG